MDLRVQITVVADGDQPDAFDALDGLGALDGVTVFDTYGGEGEDSLQVVGLLAVSDDAAVGIQDTVRDALNAPRDADVTLTPLGQITRRCRDCDTEYVIAAEHATSSSKWHSLCPSCLQLEV